MDDLITSLCAEAIGIKDYTDSEGGGDWYDPLRNDGQAMALVKKFQLDITPPPATADRHWIVRYGDADLSIGKCDNLNRAICECVAKMRSNESHNGGAEK